MNSQSGVSVRVPIFSDATEVFSSCFKAPELETRKTSCAGQLPSRFVEATEPLEPRAWVIGAPLRLDLLHVVRLQHNRYYRVTYADCLYATPFSWLAKIDFGGVTGSISGHRSSLIKFTRRLFWTRKMRNSCCAPVVAL